MDSILYCSKHVNTRATHYHISDGKCIFNCYHCRVPHASEISYISTKIENSIHDFHNSNLTKSVIDKLTNKLDTIFCHPDNIPELTNLIANLKSLNLTDKKAVIVYFSEHSTKINELIKQRDRRFKESVLSSTWDNVRKKIDEVINVLNTLQAPIRSKIRKSSIDLKKTNGNQIQMASIQSKTSIKQRNQYAYKVFPSELQLRITEYESTFSRLQLEKNAIISIVNQGDTKFKKILQEKEKEIESKDSEINNLKTKLENNHNIIVKSVEKSLQQKSRELSEKNAEIVSLKSQIKSITTEKSNLENYNSKLQVELNNVTKQLQNTKTQFQDQIIRNRKFYGVDKNTSTDVYQDCKSTETEIILSNQQSQTQQIQETGNPKQLRRQLQLSLFLPSSEIIEQFENKQLIWDFFNRINKKPKSGTMVCRLVPSTMETLFPLLCTDVKDLLIVAKASNGRRLGGFTSIGWSQKPIASVSNEGFLFSIDNKDMLTLKQGRVPSSSDKAYGPVFGQGDLRIGKKGESFSNVNAYLSSYEHTTKFEPEKQKSFLGGSMEFSITVYEVYRILFEE